VKSKPPHHDTLWASLGKLRQLFNRREKIGFGILLLAMLGSTVLETFSIGIIPVFLNLAMDPEPIIQHKLIGPILSDLGILTAQALLIWGGLALIVVFLVKTLYGFLYTYFQVRYIQNRHLRLTDRLFTAYMNAPYEFHLNRNTSELLRNVRTEANGVIYNVLSPMLSLVMQGLTVLALVGLLIAAEPLLSLAAVTLFGLAGGGYELLLKKRLRTYGQQALVQRHLIVQSVQQGLGALKEVRVLRREAYFARVLRQNLREIMLANRFSNITSGMTAPYMEFLAIAGLLGVGIALVALNRDLESIAGTLILFAAVFVRLKAGVASIVSGFTSLRFNIVSIDPVYEDLKQLERASNAHTSRKSVEQEVPLGMQHVLSLESVWYCYPGATVDALKDINVTISRGEAVAFVGPTGAGKTTIVDVILGLLEPQHGQVTVDGKNVYDNLAAWQRTVGYIPQFIYLTDDTIRRNVALGIEDDDIDEAQAWRAVRAAQLEQFVQTLPDGLDTIVGERGVRLSGGQRQRIGIARALYHDPDILIMDEATSALDNATEKEVMSAVNASKGERTLVMIAHRLTTVKDCDRLYFMQNGRIESIGTYDELLETQSEFRIMAQ
jgi:ABC-type multidrug transport system fused ATPase/permease subunit